MNNEKIYNESSANFNIALTPSVSFANEEATISVTSDQSGAVLEGTAVDVFGTLEYTLIDSGGCTIRRVD